MPLPTVDRNLAQANPQLFLEQVCNRGIVAVEDARVAYNKETDTVIKALINQPLDNENSEDKLTLVKHTRDSRKFGEEEKSVAIQKAFTGVNQIGPLVHPQYIPSKETNLRDDAALQQFLRELMYIQKAGVSHPYVKDTIDTMIQTIHQLLPENLRTTEHKPLKPLFETIITLDRVLIEQGITTHYILTDKFYPLVSQTEHVDLNEYIKHLTARCITVQERTLEAFDQKTMQAVTVIKSKLLDAEEESNQIYDYTEVHTIGPDDINQVINEAFIGTQLSDETAKKIQKTFESVCIIADEMLGQYAQASLEGNDDPNLKAASDLANAVKLALEVVLPAKNIQAGKHNYEHNSKKTVSNETIIALEKALVDRKVGQKPVFTSMFTQTSSHSKDWVPKPKPVSAATASYKLQKKSK